jgi:hypothetical protein
VGRNFRLVSYAFPECSHAAYYPETNPLVPLYPLVEGGFDSYSPFYLQLEFAETYTNESFATPCIS